MRRGLIVGKFMPLHRGHQLLIETGLANVDELTVVVYDTLLSHADFETDKYMPAKKRAGWISTLYPTVHDVVVMPDPLSDLSLSEKDDPKYAEVYADQLSFLGPFTHVFSSEDYGRPFAQAFSKFGSLPLHVSVDAARDLMPISGTKFREDMYKYRAYVDPLVYRSLIQKVVFVGTESTGKSTLARRMAHELDTMFTSEYGRTLWMDYQGRGVSPTFHDLWVIGKTQHEQEQAATLHSNKYLFCDTNPWTTMLWSEMYHGVADARLEALAATTKDEYVWFLCHNDFDWVDDGTRELRDGKAANFQQAIEDRMRSMNIPYRHLTGSLDTRVGQVMDDLGLTTGAYV